MNKNILTLDDVSALQRAIDLIRQDNVVIIPTDTVYGVAARVFSSVAVARVFDLKEREIAKPLPIFLNHIDLLNKIAIDIPTIAFSLLDKFWPGALTVIFKRNPQINSLNLCASPNTVAVRIPAHPFVLELLQHIGEPLTATSANFSGSKTPQNAEELSMCFKDRVPLILDGGAVGNGLPSTIIDLTTDPVRVVREGAISIAELQQIIPSL